MSLGSALFFAKSPLDTFRKHGQETPGLSQYSGWPHLQQHGPGAALCVPAEGCWPACPASWGALHTSKRHQGGQLSLVATAVSGTRRVALRSLNGVLTLAKAFLTLPWPQPAARFEARAANTLHTLFLGYFHDDTTERATLMTS